MTHPTPTDPPAVVDREVAGAQTEVGRADTKAGLLLAVTGLTTTAAVTILTGRALPGPAQALAWAAVAALVTSVLLLVRAVRPRLGRPGTRYGFMRWADLDPDQIHTALTASVTDTGNDGVRLHAVSRLARRKYRLITAAVEVYGAALITLASAGLLTAVTR